MIALKDGTKLATLSDARAILIEQFATVTSWGALEYAIEAVLRAAESGKRDDIANATDLIERVLRARHLL